MKDRALRIALHVVIAVEALALLVCIALPSLVAAKARHDVSRVAGDVGRVLQAAQVAYASKGAWPEDEAQGRLPESLRQALREPVSFAHENYQLDWDHWLLSDGREDDSPSREFVAVSLVTADRQLAEGVVAALGPDRVHFTVGDRVTFVLAGAEAGLR